MGFIEVSTSALNTHTHTPAHTGTCKNISGTLSGSSKVFREEKYLKYYYKEASKKRKKINEP